MDGRIGVDVELWLTEKLEEPWSSEKLSPLLTREVLLEIRKRFATLPTALKLKVLLSFITIRRRTIDELSAEITQIIHIAKTDDDEWVRVVAEMLEPLPSSDSLTFDLSNKHYENTISLFRQKLQSSRIQFFPQEYRYLHTALLPSEITTPFDASRNPHFTVQPYILEQLIPKKVMPSSVEPSPEPSKAVSQPSTLPPEAAAGSEATLLNTKKRPASLITRSTDGGLSQSGTRRGLQKNKKLRLLDFEEVKEIQLQETAALQKRRQEERQAEELAKQRKHQEQEAKRAEREEKKKKKLQEQAWKKQQADEKRLEKEQKKLTKPSATTTVVRPATLPASPAPGGVLATPLATPTTAASLPFTPLPGGLRYSLAGQASAIPYVAMPGLASSDSAAGSTSLSSLLSRTLQATSGQPFAAASTPSASTTPSPAPTQLTPTTGPTALAPPAATPPPPAASPAPAASTAALQATLFDQANRLTPSDKQTILQFLSGNRAGGFAPGEPPVKQILLNEERKINLENNTPYIESIIFEMNYANGTWRKLRRKRLAVAPQPALAATATTAAPAPPSESGTGRPLAGP